MDSKIRVRAGTVDFFGKSVCFLSTMLLGNLTNVHHTVHDRYIPYSCGDNREVNLSSSLLL